MNVVARATVSGGSPTSDERVARTSEERFRHIIDNMQEFVIATDGKGTIIMVNPSTVTLLGYSCAEELLGKNIADVIFDAADDHERVRNRMNAADTLSREVVVFRRKDGCRLTVEANFCLVRDQDRQPARMECVGRDMTERQRIEDELRRAKDVAEASTKAKSEFLANMSHELRTPLNAIVGLAHLLDRTSLAPRQRELLGKLQSSANGLVSLIGDLLDFSKIEAGKLEIEKSELDIESVLARVASTMGNKARDKGVGIKVRIAPAVPKVVVGDALRLGQVLLNLIGNAVKFTEKGDVTVAVELAARAGSVAHLRFLIRDTGPGIPTEKQQRLFEPFVQADSSITRRHGGTGLGLAISRQLVGLMGGVLSLDSQPGLGSTFSFTVRVGLPASTAEDVERPAASRLRVLAVDDSLTGREVLRAHLQAMALQVDAVTSGAEALRELETAATPYDLVLLDWYMEDMDGPDVAKRIKSDAGLKKVPHIIMVTGVGEEDVVEEVRALGVDGFITKPVDEAILRSRIEKLFGPMPAAQEEASDDEPAEAAPAAVRPGLAGRRVLVVEDNEVNQEVARGILEGAGITVVVAANGCEALDILGQDTGFDAILMDLQMPFMDGLTATRVIRSRAATASLPIVALTADAVVAQRDRCLEAGMDEFLTKPVAPDRVFEVLESIFANRPSSPAAALKVNLPKSAAMKAGAPGEGERSAHAPAGPQSAAFPSSDRLPGLDTRVALRRLMGNRALYARLLHTFAGEHADDAARIRDALDRGDTAAARATAHKLKGVAGNLSATQVFTVAARVEALLCESQLAPLGSELDELAASIKTVSASIATLPALVSEVGHAVAT